MKAKAAAAIENEPIGIIIASGAEVETPPTVFAYVWAPAPEDSDEPVEATVG